MPTHRETLRELSATQLTELTGFSPRTVRSRLAEAGIKPTRVDGRTQWWKPRESLPVLYRIAGTREGDALDLNAERARESKERADKLALENAEKRDQLIPVSTAIWATSQRFSALRSRFRGIPTAARTRLGISGEVARSLLEMIDSALDDCAKAEVPDGGDDIFERDWADSFNAAAGGKNDGG